MPAARARRARPPLLCAQAVIVHEEAACAALGAGTGSACVVDLGEQRTSVCCIDEGMPMAGCRQGLSYGALDVDALLHTLLHRQRLAATIPHLSSPPSYAPSLHATTALRAIRHTSCSIQLNDDPRLAAPADLPAESKAPASSNASAEPSVRVQLGSLSPLPPLLLFAPTVAATLQRALGYSGPPLATPSAHTVGDHTDVWDDDFISETALDRALPSGVTPAAPKEIFIGAANFAPQLTDTGLLMASGLTPHAMLGFTPLDEAIVRAVERGKSTEVKRRLYGTILLLGGLSRTPGLADYLEWRVACGWSLASDSVEGIDRVEVMRLPAGTEPESVIWRGAATLPALETGKALWILRSEWEQKGALSARESCAFSW